VLPVNHPPEAAAYGCIWIDAQDAGSQGYILLTPHANPQGEDTMAVKTPKRQKVILDLAKVNMLNAEGCPACGRKFSLGDTAVPAYGSWGDLPRLIHENEAIFDRGKGAYYEREYFDSLNKED